MKKYLVFNVTDGIYASPSYMTEKQADKFINDFPKRFDFQGFYRTADGRHIHPECVELQKIPVDKEGDIDLDILSAAESKSRMHQLGTVTEDELIDRQREDATVEDYPFSEIACTWSPNIMQLAMATREERAPYVTQLKNTIPKDC